MGVNCALAAYMPAVYPAGPEPTITRSWIVSLTVAPHLSLVLARLNLTSPRPQKEREGRAYLGDLKGLGESEVSQPAEGKNNE